MKEEEEISKLDEGGQESLMDALQLSSEIRKFGEIVQEMDSDLEFGTITGT